MLEVKNPAKVGHLCGDETTVLVSKALEGILP
jgi:hypothetical protein